MILIADSGSTKTHWKLVYSQGKNTDFTSQGLNPYFTSDSAFQNALIETFPNEFNPCDVLKVYFYGSGCASKEMAIEVYQRLNRFFENAEVEVHSDILAAARALFSNSLGLVIILGSGTNVGYYDGQNVMHKTPSLGYVIGDEGSGAYLGKKLLRHWQYNELPGELAAEFEKKYSFTRSEILTKIYSEPFPNRFLAEFVPFLADHSDHFFVKRMIEKAFQKLVDRHLLKYSMFTSLPIGVVGSVGNLFQSQLQAAIELRGGKLSKVIGYPVDELTNYHTKDS